MDLNLIIDTFFPGENVSPDLSTYEAMVGNWRGSKDPPTKEDCEIKWKQIKEVFEKKSKDNARQLEFNKRGASDHELIIAMWERIMEGKSKSSDDLQLIREQVKKDIQ